MQVNNLKLDNKRKKRKTIGRGGKKGTYCGKGNKGQKARSGAHVNPLFEGGRSTLTDHMKKKRGFKSINSKVRVINLSELDKNFKDGDIITKEALIKAGLVNKAKAISGIKILGEGKTKKKFILEKGIETSASVKSSFKVENK